MARQIVGRMIDMDAGVRDFIEKAAAIDDPSALQDLIGAKLTGLGFENFAYWGTDPISGTELKSLTNFDPRWRDHYLEEGYVTIDPVIATIKSTRIPFTWSSMPAVRRAARNRNLVLDEAAEFGIQSGGTIPIYDPTCGATTPMSVVRGRAPAVS
jgi:LuxR family transcriptional activator of conjugal transfer of Ti plasmids